MDERIESVTETVTEPKRNSETDADRKTTCLDWRERMLAVFLAGH